MTDWKDVAMAAVICLLIGFFFSTVRGCEETAGKRRVEQSRIWAEHNCPEVPVGQGAPR